MGPKAAGLSRSMGGAVWSPWPWPLSAQAGPYLSLFLIPDSHSGVRRSASNRQAPRSRLPLSYGWHSSGKGEAGQGVSYINYLAAGGTYSFDSRVCVSYIRIIDHLL